MAHLIDNDKSKMVDEAAKIFQKPKNPVYEYAPLKENQPAGSPG